MSGTPVTEDVRRGPSRVSWWKVAVGMVAAILVVAVGLGVMWYKSLPAKTSTQNTQIGGDPPSNQLCLDEDQRLRLWDIEHHGNVLARANGSYGFKAIAAALRSANADGLRKEMTADFTGKLLKEPREVRVKKPYAEVVRLEDFGKPGLPVDKNGFIEKLLEFRKPFPRPPEVKLSLMKLSPLAPDKPDGFWEGTCQLRMYQKIDPEEKAPPPPREVVIYLKYQTLEPTEERLKEGGWLRSCEITQSQVAQSPEFLLRDVTLARGIDPDKLQQPFFHNNWTQGLGGSSTGGVYLCDFNHDGYVDMLVTDVDRIALFKGGPGGKFQEVTVKCHLPQVPLERSRLGVTAAFVDLDGDGWEDLILGRYVYRNVYVPGEGNHFQAVNNSNLKDFVSADVGGYIVVDFDRDGRLDLYATRPGTTKADSWIDGKSGPNARENQLLRNKGNWQFEDVTAATGTAGGHRSTFTALWLDANNDGWPDVFVPNEFGDGVLLLNNGNGTFRQQPLVDGPGDFGTMGATYGHFDNGVYPSFFTNNMYSKAGTRVIANLPSGTYPDDVLVKMRRFVTGSQLYRSLGPAPDGQMRYEAVGKRFQLQDIGWSYGAAFLDLDNDGWLDLYATCGYISKDRDKPDG